MHIHKHTPRAHLHLHVTYVHKYIISTHPTHSYICTTSYMYTVHMHTHMAHSYLSPTWSRNYYYAELPRYVLLLCYHGTFYVRTLILEASILVCIYTILYFIHSHNCFYHHCRHQSGVLSQMLEWKQKNVTGIIHAWISLCDTYWMAGVKPVLQALHE